MEFVYVCDPEELFLWNFGRLAFTYVEIIFIIYIYIYIISYPHIFIIGCLKNVIHPSREQVQSRLTSMIWQWLLFVY